MKRQKIALVKDECPQAVIDVAARRVLPHISHLNMIDFDLYNEDIPLEELEEQERYLLYEKTREMLGPCSYDYRMLSTEQLRNDLAFMLRNTSIRYSNNRRLYDQSGATE
jgi:hypothetical protein